MTITMSLTVSTSLLPSYSTNAQKPSNLCTVSAISIPKNAIFKHLKGVPQLGLTSFSQWNGLKSSGIAISHYSARMKRKGKCRGKGVYASLFGVGAPEALVIGVVALLVFGPKGLAEVARNLGKTLRAFQPTIRELQEVSRDFKSTLEREIGLDDVDSPAQRNPNRNMPKPTPDIGVEPNGSPSEIEEVSTDKSAKITESQLLGALAQLQKEQAEEKEREETQEQEKAQLQSETTIPSQDTQIVDAPQEEASPPAMPTLQGPESSPPLQEVTAPGSAPKLESET